MRFSFPAEDDVLRECLTAQQEACVCLYHDYGKTQRETAEIMGIARPTVAFHLRGARDRIQGQAHGPQNPLSLAAGIDDSKIVATA